MAGFRSIAFKSSFLTILFLPNYCYCNTYDRNETGGNRALLEILKTNYIRYCPEVLSESLPTDWLMKTNFETPLKVKAKLFLYRFLGVDDLRQSLSIYGMFNLKWSYPCPKPDCATMLGVNNSATCTNNRLDKLYFRVSSHEIWIPTLTHFNAVDKSRPIEEQMDQYIYIEPFEDVYAGKTNALLVSIGRFETACETFSVKKFPFDTLNCSLIFDADEEANMAEFIATKFEIDRSAVDTFIGESDIWEFLGPLTFTVKPVIQMSSIKAYSRLTFSMLFKRKPNYFVANIFLPIICLGILQIAALAMTPKAAERPTFGVTVVLAFSVVLAMVFSQIPRTSEEVYLVNLVIVKFICGFILTIYELILSAFSIDKNKQPINQEPQSRKPSIIKSSPVFSWYFRISKYRMADILAGIIMGGVEIVTNAYYFSKMTSPE